MCILSYRVFFYGLSVPGVAGVPGVPSVPGVLGVPGVPDVPGILLVWAI